MSARQVDHSFLALRQKSSRPRTVGQTSLALARFMATLRWGHTHAKFYNQSKAIQQRLFEQTPRLPFYFQWIDRKMIVTRD